jgi:hypothetical protein
VQATDSRSVPDALSRLAAHTVKRATLQAIGLASHCILYRNSELITRLDFKTGFAR